MEIPCQKWEIEHANRIGKNTGKIRPVVVTITTTSRKIEILKKKKSLDGTNIYLKEDFPPNVLQKRKELQEDLKRERESGKRVILRYDKIVTLKTRESEIRTPTKRNINKRLMSISPEEAVKETGTESNNEITKQITVLKRKKHTNEESQDELPDDLFKRWVALKKPVTVGCMCTRDYRDSDLTKK
ncbi:unnamed protein product [Euphydryas editha]|uniref:Endonuclease-reverse transcriptase n=1 Tax=Euphydryas editha TaxID=104508 RepID=A0AAU9V7Y2_EUPED|nr:unnamed protein product [Euphydryas editha]